MPTKEKNTGLVTIRFDLRTVATIARFYLSKDQNFKNKSDLINQIINDLKSIIVNNSLAEEFAKTDEANLFLDNLDLDFRHKSTDAQYFKQLSLESLDSNQENSSDNPPDLSTIQGAIKKKM